MILKNALVYDASFTPRRLDVATDGERIAALAPSIPGDGIDLTGCTIVPGLVDIHIHGCGGGDTADADVQSLQKMSVFLAKHGVTSFCPTTMTQPKESLLDQLRAIKALRGNEAGARVLSVRLEGPYLSQAKKGAQCGDWIRKADLTEFQELCAVTPVSIVDVAPETEGALDFARSACATATVSAAHTAASFEQMQAGLAAGFSHGTHLFNAMEPIRNRAPGAVTALLLSESATAEMICDGFHNHPAVVCMAQRLLGEDRFLAVSDAMRAAGTGDGEFTLGGQTVFVRDGQARLADGTIAASTTNLFTEFHNLLDWGIPFAAALRACSINPARVARADGEVGSIEVGKRADLLVLDAAQQIRCVFVGGIPKGGEICGKQHC